MNRDRTVIIVLFLTALACGGSPATTPTTSAPAATIAPSNPAPERGFYMGVAGLIPEIQKRPRARFRGWSR